MGIGALRRYHDRHEFKAPEVEEPVVEVVPEVEQVEESEEDE
jgi:hypothetical protein